MLALTGFVALFSLSLRASPSLGAPPSRDCASVGLNAPNEVAAKGSLSDGQVLGCETQRAMCPRGVWGCVALLRGKVIAGKVKDMWAPGQIARQIEGVFGIGDRSDGATINAYTECTGTRDPPECLAEAAAYFPPGADMIEGVCQIHAGRLIDNYPGIGRDIPDTPTPVYIEYCDLTVTALKYPKGCSPPPFPPRRSGDSTVGRASAVAAAKTRCRAPKRIPVRPEPKPPLPPPIRLKTPPIDAPPFELPPPDCSKDNPNDPPTPGCVRVTVRVIPAPLPSDPGNESIGVGVGSATIEPGGTTVHCLNPEDEAACVVKADIPNGRSIAVTAQPGSIADEDPPRPPDSAFWKFAGACSGSGACTFMPSPAGNNVQVYFIPAMVTLTLKASGDGGHANMTANEFKGGGLEPMGPVYCGFTYPANPLPCKVMVRVEKFAQVEANPAGDPNIVVDGFSSNCTPEASGSSFCDLRMTSDQTVIAMFGAVGVG